MTERPILFSAPMVRAILEGRKTQTRRVVNPQPSSGVRTSVFVGSGVEDGHGREIRPRYGVPGDRLWVRETWAEPSGNRPDIYRYRADFHDHADTRIRWRPSIHMPRAACRIGLYINAVRIERLQAITDADAIAEGIDGKTLGQPPRLDYANLWNQLNEKRGFGWDVNPWVWVIDFSAVAP
jgi:hypothetical protein